MAALTHAQRFAVLREVLAIAEERGSVPLADAAAEVGLTTEQLRAVLEPVLFLEFRDEEGELVSLSGAFLLDEHDRLSVDSGHWLRDLTVTPPDRDTALRLLVAATHVRALVPTPVPDLDRAAGKLQRHLQVILRMPVAPPPLLDVVQSAHARGRSIVVRYLSDGQDEARTRELLVWRVFAQWGRWYVRARDVTESEAKFFRIDRMLEATVGDTAFDPPDDAEGIPEWFDLSANLRTLRIRVAARALERLPSPHRIEPVAEPGVTEPGTVEADVVEVDVIVSGDRHRDHVLLSLPPEAEVLAPPEAVEHRRALAARMLAAYE